MKEGVVMRLLTTLGRSKVLSGSWSTWSASASLLNAQGTTFVDLTLESVLGGIGLVALGKVDEAEATRLLGVWVQHDVALDDFTVLAKETGDVLLSELWVDAGDEKIGAGVSGVDLFRRWVLFATTVFRWSWSVETV